MNLNVNNPVIIREDDYELLKPYVSKLGSNSQEMNLSAELSRATIVKKDKFPLDVIRLNSKIQITDQDNGASRTVIIVLPNQADIKENKISILTPIASALIGFREGDVVQWAVPAGMKKFKIAEVINEHEP